jgi:hypothetical protein
VYAHVPDLLDESQMPYYKFITHMIKVSINTTYHQAMLQYFMTLSLASGNLSQHVE